MKRIIDISPLEYDGLKEKRENGEGLGFFRNLILDSEAVAKPTDYVDCKELASQYADWYGYGYADQSFYKYLQMADKLPREDVLKKYGMENTFYRTIENIDAVEAPPIVEIVKIVRNIVDAGYQRDCEVERERNGVVAVEISDEDKDAIVDRVLMELEVTKPEDFYTVLATNGERVTDAVFHQIDQMKSEIEEFLEQDAKDM